MCISVHPVYTLYVFSVYRGVRWKEYRYVYVYSFQWYVYVCMHDIYVCMEYLDDLNNFGNFLPQAPLQTHFHLCVCVCVCVRVCVCRVRACNDVCVGGCNQARLRKKIIYGMVVESYEWISCVLRLFVCGRVAVICLCVEELPSSSITGEDLGFRVQGSGFSGYCAGLRV